MTALKVAQHGIGQPLEPTTFVGAGHAHGVIHNGVGRGLGVLQLIQGNNQQTVNVAVSQRPAQQLVQRAAQPAVVTQRAVGDVHHRRPLGRGQRRMLTPGGGQRVGQVLARQHGVENMGGEGLDGLHDVKTATATRGGGDVESAGL